MSQPEQCRRENWCVLGGVGGELGGESETLEMRQSRFKYEQDYLFFLSCAVLLLLYKHTVILWWEAGTWQPYVILVSLT